jgi:2,4-dienoyl-CoA reductase-like NADH-dependent reductase (Old Yellow Enzyme family)
MVQYRSHLGVPSDFHLVHLGKFALGGFGVVMTEATAAEPRGPVSGLCPGIWDDTQKATWKRIAS